MIDVRACSRPAASLSVGANGFCTQSVLPVDRIEGLDQPDRIRRIEHPIDHDRACRAGRSDGTRSGNCCVSEASRPGRVQSTCS